VVLPHRTMCPGGDGLPAHRITDTSMLRPQVFALQEGEASIGFAASEKQAIDAALGSLTSEDRRFWPHADRYWNARGGSHTDGGAFVFSFAPTKSPTTERYPGLSARTSSGDASRLIRTGKRFLRQDSRQRKSSISMTSLTPAIGGRGLWRSGQAVGKIGLCRILRHACRGGNALHSVTAGSSVRSMCSPCFWTADIQRVPCAGAPSSLFAMSVW